MSNLVILIDWENGGHNAQYIAGFALALHGLGYNIAILCCPELGSQVKPLIEQISRSDRVRYYEVAFPHHLPIRPASLQRFIREKGLQQRITRQIIKAELDFGCRARLIFFCCIYEHSIAINRLIVKSISRSFSGMYLHPKQFVEDNSSEAGKHLYSFLLHPRLESLTVLSEDLSDKMLRTIKKDVVVFPDIANGDVVTDHPLRRRLRRFAGSSPLIVLAGHLNPWKGAGTLARVALSREAKKYSFAFVGKLPVHLYKPVDQDAIIACMHESENALFHTENIRDGAPYNAILEAADIVFASFDDFPFSSNTLTKCAILEKPIIVSDGGLMAKRVRDYQLGEIVPQRSPSRTIAAIDSLCNSSRNSTPRWRDYRIAHGQETLALQWKKLLESR